MTQTINISLPKELIEQIDKLAKAHYASRSDYIRQALVGKLKKDQAEQQDWDVFNSLSAEITRKATEQGYTTDQDFVRAVKEVRQASLAKHAK